LSSATGTFMHSLQTFLAIIFGLHDNLDTAPVV